MYIGTYVYEHAQQNKKGQVESSFESKTVRTTVAAVYLFTSRPQHFFPLSKELKLNVNISRNNL